MIFNTIIVRGHKQSPLFFRVESEDLMQLGLWPLSLCNKKILSIEYHRYPSTGFIIEPLFFAINIIYSSMKNCKFSQNCLFSIIILKGNSEEMTIYSIKIYFIMLSKH
ncbi:hypothetical protein CBF80_08205 [Lactobacillus taiwanensis]|nr:hypothetical protein CBF80_08205 [Lactobacillus taiwanensis]